MEFEYEAGDVSEHELHCKHCNNSRQCSSSRGSSCPLVHCPNKCGQFYHECKSNEHIDETCPNFYVPCLNLSNGCKLKVKRSQLGVHLQSCVASVIRCSSFTLRKVYNKDEVKGNRWPDPIAVERAQNASRMKDEANATTNLTETLLANDYETLRAFAEKNPLLFQRMYGYLIGLKLESFSRKNNKFGFLRYLLKNVKSKIFKVEAISFRLFNL